MPSFSLGLGDLNSGLLLFIRHFLRLLNLKNDSLKHQLLHPRYHQRKIDSDALKVIVPNFFRILAVVVGAAAAICLCGVGVYWACFSVN